MAKFINDESESLEEFDTLEQNEDTTDDGVALEEKETSPEIPEKYQGKSIAEIVQMHQEAEKLLGRHSSEVGELRSVVDDFIKANLDKESPEKNVEEDVDFWSDPDAAFDKKLKNHPAIKKAEEAATSFTRQEVMTRLNTQYPEWESTIQDEGFAEWVKGSKVRMQLYTDASNNFDWDAANELLGTWDTINKAKQAANVTAKDDMKQQRKAASTGSSKGADTQPSKKIYRRSDIINLMRNDPKRYAQLGDEITRAYQEGRVR